MKKRIISFILVVVMAVLALASCTYNLAEDKNLKSYYTLSSDFSKIFDEIEIEDGDFTTDPETREKKIKDYIYGQYITAAGTTAKYEGKVDANDVFKYCYYAEIETGEGDSKTTVIVDASKMNIKNVLELKLGSTDLTVLSALEKAVKDKLAQLDEIDNYIYGTETATTEKYAEGDVAYISYTYQKGEEKAIKYANVRVVLKKNEAANGIHQPVVDELLSKKDSLKIGSAAGEFKNAEDDTIKYTGAVVNWTVNKIKKGDDELATQPDFFTLQVTLTEETTFTGVDTKDGEASLYKKKVGDAVTYYVYPVSYISVEDFDATTLIETLYSGNIAADTLDCFKEKDELIKAYKEKKAAYDKLEQEYKTLDTAYEKLKLEYGELNADENKKDEAAEKKTEMDKKLEERDAKGTARDTAKTEYENALKALIDGTGKDKIEEQYTEKVKEHLLDEYNAELKENLAKAVWTSMKANVTVTDYPEKLVRELYEILYNGYEYTFYESEADASNPKSLYNQYNGVFEEYIKAEKKADTFQNAKHAIWSEAKTYVDNIIIVYAVAENQGQMADKDAIKEYKKTTLFESAEASHGEANALAAYQFDLLMDYFLTEKTETKTEGDETVTTVVKDANGVVQYEYFKKLTTKTK